MNYLYKLVTMKIARDFRKADTARDAGLGTPPEIVRFNDISYGPHGRWNLLDVYRPISAAAPLPVIVNFHGGGYFYGDKELYQFYCMDMALRGFVVINANYRLAPDYLFPAPLEDLNEVVKWTLRRGEEYGGDVRSVFFAGDSAGAQLTHHYSAILTDPSFAALFDFKTPEGFLPRAVAVNCGIYDILNTDMKNMRLMLTAYAGRTYRRRDARLDVLRHTTSAFPPCYIATAYHDFLYPCAQPFFELLRSRRVEAVYKVYGSPDAFDIAHVFHENIRLPEGRRCNDDEAEFFKSHI